MRVFFIHAIPNEAEGYQGYYQGVGYLSAVLKQNGHGTALWEPCLYSESSIRTKIKEAAPQLVAVSATTNQMDLSRKIIKFIHREYDLPIVLGGIHATVLPEETIRTEGLLGLCRGEGEFPLLELVNALEQGKSFLDIPNMWFNHHGRSVKKNPMRPNVAQLDSLPFPDRNIYNDYDAFIKNKWLGAEFMASRGCPYRCTYCVENTLWNMSKETGSVLRFRGVDNILSEIDAVVQKYGRPRHIGFHDEIFAVNRKWLIEFCQKYPKRFDIPFWCNSRPDTLDEKTMPMLKEAGCFEIHMGVESGNDYIRNEVFKRRLSKDTIRRAFRLGRTVGIKRNAFVMLGSPHETVGTIKESIRFLQELDPDYLHLAIFYPYPGTESYELVKSKGWINEKRRIESFFQPKSKLDQPSISQKDLTKYYKMFKILVHEKFLV